MGVDCANGECGSMKLPALIHQTTIDRALIDAVDDGHGNLLVPAYEVPDHYTEAGCAYPGLARLNRIGRAWRSELIGRTKCKQS